MEYIFGNCWEINIIRKRETERTEEFNKVMMGELFPYVALSNTHLSKREKYINQVDVKNGYATLSDKVFISKKFDFKNDIIDVVKSSTGEWFKSIYPYNKGGSVKELNQLDDKVKNYLLSHKDKLKARSITKDTKWYEFGRSQAIGDTYVKKMRSAQ